MGRDAGAEGFSLQLWPYSQHLTRGPRCAHAQQQQFQRCKSRVGPKAPADVTPTIQHDGVITGVISVHRERTHLIHQII